MAGQDPFTFDPTPGPDALTGTDRGFGFHFLSESKIGVDPRIGVDTSPPLGAGRYMLLCNIRNHYFKKMYAALVVNPNNPTP